MTEHCIVQENDQAPIGDEEKEQNDQAPIGDEEKEQQQRSQIRKKEESKVLKLKVEKSTLWEEDTEKNLDKSENVCYNTRVAGGIPTDYAKLGITCG